MARRFTIFLVPDGTSRSKKFVFSSRFLKGVAGGIASILLGCFFVFFQYFNYKDKIQDIDALESVTKNQLNQISNFSYKINELEEKLDKLGEFDSQIRAIAKIDPARKPSLKKKRLGGPSKEDADRVTTLLKSTVKPYENYDFSSTDSITKTIKNRLEKLDIKTNKQQSSFKELLEIVMIKKPVITGVPLVWPSVGATLSGFGFRTDPVTYKKHMHEGIDIKVEAGTQVEATADGVVVYAGWFSDYGYLVVIDHKNGISTRYGHLSKILVNVGDKVSRGNKIALSGNTGKTTGPHLHYEVRVGGIPVDPTDYLLN